MVCYVKFDTPPCGDTVTDRAPQLWAEEELDASNVRFSRDETLVGAWRHDLTVTILAVAIVVIGALL